MSTVVVKYNGRALTIAAGLVSDCKEALAAQTGLASNCMKIIRAGKTLEDQDEVPPNAKGVMCMRCAAQPVLLNLSVREIVTGRLAPKVEVAPNTPHDELLETITKALRLPPCDEYTEVRLFLPHIGVLMRPDLTLADYALPPATTRAVEVFAVPCPKVL